MPDETLHVVGEIGHADLHSGGDKPARKRFKRYPIDYFHIDIAEVQTAEGKLYLFVAIDRTSKFAYVESGGAKTYHGSGGIVLLRAA